MKNTETSGGTRYSEGKPGGWWYAPIYGLREVAKVWESGAEKYAPRDWVEGQSFSTLLDCAFRHMLEVSMHGPWARDDDEGGTGAYHLACVAWNILALLTFMTLGRSDLDDVSPWFGVTAEDRRAAADLWADGHPGSIVEIAAEIAEGRERRELTDRAETLWSDILKGVEEKEQKRGTALDTIPKHIRDIEERERERVEAREQRKNTWDELRRQII